MDMCEDSEKEEFSKHLNYKQTGDQVSKWEQSKLSRFHDIKLATYY